MSRLKPPYGTTATLTAAVVQERDLAYDTTLKRFVMGDGVDANGRPLALEDEGDAISVTATGGATKTLAAWMALITNLGSTAISSVMAAVVTAATTNAAARAMGVPAILDNIAALQAVTWSSSLAPQTVILRYNYVAGDGGGTFDYSSDTSSADNGGTIIRTSTSGTNLRYKRMYSGPVDVTWFGARGDGSTDDGAAFSAANAAGAAKFVPYKSSGYNLGTTSLTVASGETWTGESGVKLKSTATTKLFDITAYYDRALIQGFTIDMTGSGASSQAIRLKNDSAVVWTVELRDLDFRNCVQAIGCAGAANSVVEIYIEKVRCTLTRGLQISLPYSRGFVFLKRINIDQTISTNTYVSYGGILIEKPAGVFLEDVNVTGQAGNWATATAYTNVYDSGVYGVKIDGATGNDGYIWMDRVRCESSMGHGLLISDMIYVHADQIGGHNCLGLPVYFENILEGNITNITARGAIGITGAAASMHGVSLIDCQGLQITNVNSKNCTGNGIHFSGSNCLHNTVSNVQCWDNTGYGVASASSADYNQVCEPVSIKGNTAGPTSISANNRVDRILSTITYTVAAGATNVCVLTGTVRDGEGNAIAEAHVLTVYISEASTGIGITADAYSTGASVTTGTAIITETANKAWTLITNASGVFAISITDSAKPADQYLVAVNPKSGRPIVSAASAALWGA